MTEEIRKKLEDAKTKEEIDAIIADDGNELTDEELEKIAGGWWPPFDSVKKPPYYQA